jgi:hypothetical protein
MLGYSLCGFVFSNLQSSSGRVAQGGTEIICKVLKINIGGVGVLIKW